MSKHSLYFCISLCAALASLSADELILSPEGTSAELPLSPPVQAAAEKAVQKPAQPTAAPVFKLPEVPFSPFTGKIKAKKVRLRLAPDLDSHVVRELTKSDLVSVVGEKGDFWAVEPPAGLKAYVFRSFILDNVVEANRVNVRLEPSLDAPIIAHLNAGDKVNGTQSPLNNKWLEIKAPASTRCYVAKNLVEFAGGPEVKAQMDKRRNTAEQLFLTTSLLTAAELNKPFEKIEIDHLSRNYKTVIQDYADFPEFVDKAQESLTQLQEAYLQKRIAFLEAKNTPRSSKETIEKEDAGIVAENATDKMKLWEPIEEAMYLTWAHVNESKDMNEYYEEQKLAAVAVSGILEAYTACVKNKPGDFIVRDKGLPVAYVYSTHVNLQNLVGKKVNLTCAARPNNNFAFPAYTVLSAE